MLKVLGLWGEGGDDIFGFPSSVPGQEPAGLERDDAHVII